MRNGDGKNSCLFGEELAAYIYGELDGVPRDRFETHLLECGGCTAELADISFSRLGVYEWHRDEFVPLATPNFAIPYESKAAPAAARSGWVEMFQKLVSPPARFAFAGGSLALIAVAAWFGFLSNSPSGADLGERTPGPAPKVLSESILEVTSAVPAKNAKGPATEQLSRSRVVLAGKSTPPMRVKYAAQRTKPAMTVAGAQNAPRLGSFVEPEDTSLRLADLVADIDTKD